MQACTPEEKALVEDMLAHHPELKAELNLIEDALYQTASQQAIAPPASLKNTIKDQLQFNDPITESTPQKEIYINLRWYRLALAASLVTTALVGFLAYSYKQKLSMAEAELAVLNEKNSSLTEQINRASYQTNTLNKQLAVLQNAAFKQCKLAGVGTHTDAKMNVYWNPTTQETYVAIESLPDLPQGKQYQLWRVRKRHGECNARSNALCICRRPTHHHSRWL